MNCVYNMLRVVEDLLGYVPYTRIEGIRYLGELNNSLPFCRKGGEQVKFALFCFYIMLLMNTICSEYRLLGLPTDKSYSIAKKDLRRRGFGSVLSFVEARSLVNPLWML